MSAGRLRHSDHREHFFLNLGLGVLPRAINFVEKECHILRVGLPARPYITLSTVNPVLAPQISHTCTAESAELDVATQGEPLSPPILETLQLPPGSKCGIPPHPLNSFGPWGD